MLTLENRGRANLSDRWSSRDQRKIKPTTLTLENAITDRRLASRADIASGNGRALQPNPRAEVVRRSASAGGGAAGRTETTSRELFSKVALVPRSSAAPPLLQRSEHAHHLLLSATSV